jgi:hypothetical protein
MHIPKNSIFQTTTGTGSYQLREEQGNTLLWPVILFGIAALLMLASPASAGEQYMSGSPELSAYLGGTNEFSPGQEVQIAVVVENSGTNQYKFVTVTLESGDSPFIIKSDPQMLGDLKASSTATGKFTVRIPSDTPAGIYNLPVKLNYTYLYTAEQYGVDTVQNFYKTKDVTFEFPIRVKPDVRVSVVDSKFNELNAGTEGSITLSVKNIGHENGKKAILTIARNDGSPIVPTEASAYIGDFPAGGTVTGIFRATVSDSAEAQTYPLDVFVKYENSDGDTISSDTETIGVPVGDKIKFVIISDPVTVTPGQKKVITVKYKNTGGAIAHQAQARVSMIDPFTSNDDTAYLGEVAPGETKEASFLVTTDKSATLKSYGIDSEIRYRDAFDNQIISDPIKLPLNVSEDTGLIASLMKNPLLLAVLAVVIIGAGYAIYRKRENR